MADKKLSTDNSQLSTDNSQLSTHASQLSTGRKKGPIYEKSFSFAVRIVKLARYLQEEKKEFVLSKQVLRSGTAIGALVREAEHAESKADFAHKMNIALKEANETLYWLELLYESETITEQSFNSVYSDSEELVKLLVSIVKTTKASLHAK